MKKIILTASAITLMAVPALAKKKNPPTESAVKANSESVSEEAKIKDAKTGKVAPAQPSGTIDISTPETMVNDETLATLPVPINVKFSGFAWVETEDTNNFGYNGASAIPNFDQTNPESHQSFSNFLSNLQIDVSKDKTNFTTVLEVGEMINGESTTGGVQGGRKMVLEVRNVYLTHEINSSWGFKAGLLPLSSDPNSFIVADHFTGAVLDYKNSNIAATLWSAKAFDNKPGVTPTTTTPAYVNPDQYTGLSVQPQLSEASKLNAFAVIRRTTESLYDAAAATTTAGRSDYNWYGATYDFAFNDVYSMQATGIYNEASFRTNATGLTDRAQSNLADLKLKALWKEKGFDILIEGLATSGASGAVDPTTNAAIIGSRKGFNSPDPGAAYLFTIATSDGADDAPGTAKESVIGNLSQPEGLQIALVKLNQAFTDKLSGFVRVGTIRTAAANALTLSTNYGDEVDLNLGYELSPGTTLQMDYGYFKPGAFFQKQEAAQLFATRLKFLF